MAISTAGGLSLTNTANLADVTGTLAAANGGAISTNPLSVYAAGTAYSITASAAAVTFGTTSPSLTLTQAGTYLLRGTATMNLAAATFAAVRNVTFKLRRTNNSALDIANTSSTLQTQITTLLSFSMPTYAVEATYTTTNTNDAIAMFAGIDTQPTAGSLDCVAASIVATRLQP